MAPHLDIDRVRAAWDHILGGGSISSAGIHKTQGMLLKRLQGAEWTWEHVEFRLVRGHPLSGLDGPPPDMTIAEPPRVMTVAPRATERASKGPGWQPYNPAGADIQSGVGGYSRLGGKRSDLYHRNLMAHEDATLARSQRILRWVDAALDGAEPFLKLRTTRSTKQGQCRTCGAETPVEEVVIHPLRANIAGLVKAVKEANEGIAMAMHIPSRYLPAKAKDIHLEVSAHLDRLSDAFKTAFNEAIEKGLIEEDVAIQIWTAAKRAIDGGPTGEL